MKLRVWWMPRVPMNSFYVSVQTIAEAKLVLDTLADYDIFQFENRVKGDYSNAGGLQRWDEKYQDWCDWHTEDGYLIDDFTLEQLRNMGI